MTAENGKSGKRFPLSLDSLAEKSAASRTTAGSQRGRVVTPQTATRNAAASTVLQGGRAAVAGWTSGGRPAAPSKSAVSTAARSPTSLPAVETAIASRAMNGDGLRAAMVERVARQGVRDKAVLAALNAVPRHMFLEPALAGQAYIDASLPIGYHQTISQPYIVARMIEILRDNRRDGTLDKVLEIGTGCGYQSAVLSMLARDVYSIERIKPLHELAKTNLRPLRIPNIRLHYGDGMLGFPQVAPFDGIILAAAGIEVPQALLEQLAVGGRLIAPVGGRSQVLQLIERTGRSTWNSSTLEACHFVPLRSGTVG